MFDENNTIRFLRLYPGTKRPIGENWNNPLGTTNYSWIDLQKKRNANEGVGILCGTGTPPICIIDIDRKGNEFEKINETIKILLPKTFEIKTPHNGTHYYFYVKNIEKMKRTYIPLKQGNGEIRGAFCNVATVGTLIDGKGYEITNDQEPVEVPIESIFSALANWIPEEQPTEQPKEQEKIDLNVLDVLDTSGLKKHGNEFYGPHPIHGSQTGMNFWVNPTKNTFHCFRCDSGGDALIWVAIKEGIIDCSQAKKGCLTGKTFIDVVKRAEQLTGKKLLKEPQKEENVEQKPGKNPEENGMVAYRDYSFFEKLKPERRFLVQGLLFPKTITMLYSPPGEFKSLLSLLLGVCIANGKPFLGVKTQKNPVLLCDKENNAQTIKKRLIGIRKGLKMHKKRFPLHICWSEGSLDSLEWVQKLEKTVQQCKVKLVIFDTLHRFSDYEENAADDLNRLYTTVFQPLVENHDCSVLFLHHCTKEGNYRGTSDFLGQVDAALALHRKGAKGINPAGFKLENVKNRWGEMEKIEAEISFSEEKIQFRVIPEGEKIADTIGRVSYLKECTREIENLFPILGTSLKRSLIIDHFEMLRNSEPKRDYSLRTIDRSLKWLCLNGFLARGKQKEYVRPMLASEQKT